GGAVVRFDPTEVQPVLNRHEVCPTPRGLAWQAEQQHMLVGCFDGRLIGLDTNGNTITSTMLDRDIRDVTVDALGDVYVTRMRSAEVLVLDGDLQLAQRKSLPDAPSFDFITGEQRGMSASVAWRTIPK